MEERSVQSCIICGSEKDSGIQVCEQFICLECEKEMVSTDVQDAKYMFFINRMKLIWYKKNA